MIPFNIPFITKTETAYIEECMSYGKISGDGLFTRKCQNYFEEKYGFNKTLLTNSCTGALEMAALLLDIKPGDEVIVPSYTFVSTANAFVVRGAKIVFADSNINHPNISPQHIENLITEKTKAIVVVHYAGMACDMEAISALAQNHGIVLIEDAAQAVHAFYQNKPLGTFGQLATFSFHDTKNITCGEGGMLVINDPAYIARAEIIREKGTNRTAFLNGEVNRYEWMDIGSSFLLADLNAAFLYAQLLRLEDVTSRRLELWNYYNNKLKDLIEYISLPEVELTQKHNASIFYIVCKNEKIRTELMQFLKKADIHTASHYVPLHSSSYAKMHFAGQHNTFENTTKFATALLRLPLYYDLQYEQLDLISMKIHEFYGK